MCEPSARFGLTIDQPELQVRLGVGVVLRDERGRILLEKRSDCGLWGFPGGSLEPGESVSQAAVREVREETGLEIEVTRLLGVYSEPKQRIVSYSDRTIHKVDILVEARITSGQLRMSRESELLQFFYPHLAPQQIVPPAQLPLADICAGRSSTLR